MNRSGTENLKGYAAQISQMAVGRARAAGEVGEKWLENLDSIVENLERRWNVKVIEVLLGGLHAFVGCAADENGAQYVLKAEVPDTTEDEFMNGIRALQLADGRGYGKIFEVDISRRACLMEKLGDTLNSKNDPVEQQIRVIAMF